MAYLEHCLTLYKLLNIHAHFTSVIEGDILHLQQNNWDTERLNRLVSKPTKDCYWFEWELDQAICEFTPWESVKIHLNLFMELIL